MTPFPGQKPPTSFGAPPGAPSAPGAPPYPQSSGTYGFPSSYGCPPTPFSPYSNINQRMPQAQNSPAPYPTSAAASMPGYPQYHQPAPVGYSQPLATQNYQHPLPGYPSTYQQTTPGYPPPQHQQNSCYPPSPYPPPPSQPNQSHYQLPSMNNSYLPPMDRSPADYQSSGAYSGCYQGSGQGSGRQHIASAMINQYNSAPPSSVTQKMTAHKKVRSEVFIVC